MHNFILRFPLICMSSRAQSSSGFLLSVVGADVLFNAWCRIKCIIFSLILSDDFSGQTPWQYGDINFSEIFLTLKITRKSFAVEYFCICFLFLASMYQIRCRKK